MAEQNEAPDFWKMGRRLGYPGVVLGCSLVVMAYLWDVENTGNLPYYLQAAARYFIAGAGAILAVGGISAKLRQ